ncbi:MAG: efflux RND transporter periplasmic adaptor subunit [Chloroflexi bacterium]|nr:efflux RND transporter periplasmic adaptor subunit [Chloroflexota bacterium]
MKKYRTLIIIGVVVASLVAVFFIVRSRQQAQSATDLQTVVAERGALTAIVGATGAVRANQTAILAWQTSGAVDSVAVQPGDEVQAGDVLATLAQDSLSQNIILAQADLVAAQRNLEMAQDSGTSRAQAQLALLNAQKAYDTARNNLAALEDRGRADPETVENAWAQYIIARQAADTAQTNYDRLAERPEDDPLRAQAYTTLYNALQARDRAYNNWNYYFAQPSARELAEAGGKLALAEAQLEDAQREWDRQADGPDPDDIAAAQARVTAIQATLNLARLATPFGGTVTEVRPLPGDQATPGTAAFRVDDLSSLRVDVQISEVDINSIRVGQPVTLAFDAILDRTYRGEVVEVAQVGTVIQGVVSFNVTVELQDPDELVKPGMTAAVTIVVNELQGVLMVPNRAVRLVEGQRVVYVLQNGQAVRVDITLGASSDLVSEVVGGDLQEGDLIILNPPAEFNSSGGPPFMGR